MLRSEQELAALAVTGERVPARVTGVKPFGVFVDIGGVSGLLHRSEMDLLPRQPVPCIDGLRASHGPAWPQARRVCASSPSAAL